MIIECSQAKVLFVSDTINEVLNEEPESWIGTCLYDVLHPKVSLLASVRATLYPELMWYVYSAHAQSNSVTT